MSLQLNKKNNNSVRNGKTSKLFIANNSIVIGTSPKALNQVYERDDCHNLSLWAKSETISNDRMLQVSSLENFQMLLQQLYIYYLKYVAQNFMLALRVCIICSTYVEKVQDDNIA